MYWAKKILEWTGEGPEEALDGRFTSTTGTSWTVAIRRSCVGCMWAICGVHDQGWKER